MRAPSGVASWGRDGLKGGGVVVGRGGVGRAGAGGAVGGQSEVVKWVGCVVCGCVYVCPSHTHVLFQWEDVCFVLEVVYGCGVCAPVAILRAVFSVVWSFCICVSAMSGCQAG